MSSSLPSLLSKLIATPSVNPAHSDDPSISGEERMAKLFETLFHERGLSVERLYPLGKDRPGVIGRTRPGSIQKTLLLEMHLDTVGVEGMTIDPFQAEIKDGKIYGRGSCDMKGAMAALFHALTLERIQALNERGVQLILLGAPDEETGLNGATALAAEGWGADAAIILEPTGCRPVIAHKGALWYDVHLRGRSGHGSQPQSGVSTNAALAEFLPALFEIHKTLTEEYTHPLLGTSTLNLGKITGGHTYNIIPERTLLNLDRRVIPNEPVDRFLHRVNDKIREMIDAGSLVDGECRSICENAAFATPEDCPLVNILQHSIHRVTGQEAPVSGTSWVSDASPLSQTCSQILVFGPGDIAQAHTDNEYIEIGPLETASAIFADFLDHYT